MRRHADNRSLANPLKRPRPTLRARRVALLRGLTLLALGLATLGVGCAPEQLPPEGYELVFEEEFGGEELDGEVWNTAMRWGQNTDNELQTYVPEALGAANGRLSVTARETPGAERPYSSGAIASFDKYAFTYGYAEIRAQVPTGRGLWPAFWLAPVDEGISEEIDVMEILGQQPNTVYMALHYDDENGVHQEPQEEWSGPDFSEGFHTFGVDWRPDEIIWYVDGYERARQTVGVPSTPMYLIANLALGGDWAGWPDDETGFPAAYVIDYIRVYQPVE